MIRISRYCRREGSAVVPLIVLNCPHGPLEHHMGHLVKGPKSTSTLAKEWSLPHFVLLEQSISYPLLLCSRAYALKPCLLPHIRPHIIIPRTCLFVKLLLRLRSSCSLKVSCFRSSAPSPNRSAQETHSMLHRFARSSPRKTEFVLGFSGGHLLPVILDISTLLDRNLAVITSPRSRRADCHGAAGEFGGYVFVDARLAG